MKKTISLLSLIFSLSAFAETICYKSYEQLYFIPEQICIDEAKMDIDSGMLYLTTSTPETPQILIAEKLARHNEDRFNFKASVVLINRWESGCGEGISSKLYIEGSNDNYGFVDPNYLNITVSYQMTNDTCHSSPTEGIAHFSRY